MNAAKRLSMSAVGVLISHSTRPIFVPDCRQLSGSLQMFLLQFIPTAGPVLADPPGAMLTMETSRRRPRLRSRR
jgi:hypothetical protein